MFSGKRMTMGTTSDSGVALFMGAAARRNYMIRCLVTDGTFALDPARWLAHKAHWIREGVELLQIRERDLTARELAELTRTMLRIPNPRGTKILVNDRADVAVACGAHGVHLRGGSIAPERFARSDFLVTVSCHEMDEAERTTGATFVLLGPIYSPLSKNDPRPALGPAAIKDFTRRTSAPVLALGGLTAENAGACLDAGAVGIAGITLFTL
jgi:thiamine-phosphate pyrophosphorylase